MAPAKNSPDMLRLRDAVAAAELATRTPPEPGMESWPWTSPQQHLTKTDWRLLWSVVREIRRGHPAVFRKFLFQQTIADRIVDYVQEYPESVSLDGAARYLRSIAKQNEVWLVEIPLAHLQTAEEIVPVAEYAALVKADDSRDRRRFGPHLKDVFGLSRHLSDEIAISARWHHPPEAPGLGEDIVDRRIFSSLVIAEEGTEELSVALATTRARLATAMWCLLTPPRFVPGKTRPVWPTVSRWSPAPYLEYQPRRKPYNPRPMGLGHAGTRGNSVTHYNAYRLTGSAAYRAAPFVAMQLAHQGNDAATAILSAARSLYLAGHEPNDLERTERLLHVWRAKEALSHRGVRGKGTGASDARWDNLVANLSLRQRLVDRGYEHDEVDEAFRFAKSLRDLTTHFADDVLVNLNYPSQRTARMNDGSVLRANTLSLSAVTSDWPVMLAAVRDATKRLATAGIRDGWSESAFHAKFSKR